MKEPRSKPTEVSSNDTSESGFSCYKSSVSQRGETGVSPKDYAKAPRGRSLFGEEVKKQSSLWKVVAWVSITFCVLKRLLTKNIEVNLFMNFKAWMTSQFCLELMNIVLHNTEKQRQPWLRNVMIQNTRRQNRAFHKLLEFSV